MRKITVRFWGVRGSIAAGGPQFAEVGGNTSCVEVRVGDDRIIFDAGTGLRALGDTLGKGTRATFFFSHLHWDHIQGFPFFAPAYAPGSDLTLYGPGEGGGQLLSALVRQMEAPSFPVGLSAMRAKLDFRSIAPGDEVAVGAAQVRAAALDHPQGCLGYRVTLGEQSVVYATDTEHPGDGTVDPAALELARGASLLIYDSQYTEDEYQGRSGPPRKGWGHSTTDEACRVARVAGVGRLALFHHDPTHDDRFVERMVRRARSLFPNVSAAREGMTVSL